MYEDRTPSLSPEEWASAYRLAKIWEFDQLRDYIYKQLDNSVKEPILRIKCADLLGLENWIAPAFAELCRRAQSLTAEEGAMLGLARFAEVCKQRERGRRLYSASEYEVWLDKSVISTATE